MSTDVLEKPDTRTTDTDGEHDRMKHYVPKFAWERAIFWDEDAIALCGKRMKPTRDPDRYEMCPTCEERYAALSE